MQFLTKSVVFGQVFANQVLAGMAVLPSTALLATSKLRLSNDPNFNPTPLSTVASLAANEAVFTGYTAGGVAVALVQALNLSTQIQGAGQVKVFVAVAGTPFVPDTLTGWWIDDGTVLQVASAFGASGPYAIGSPGDFLELLALLPVNLLQLAS